MDTQPALFDLSTIPRQTRARYYVHGYSEKRLNPRIWQWYDYLGSNYQIVSLSPALLCPTQRTIIPRIVEYYRRKGVEKNTDGLLPIVLYLDGTYFLMDGHHRWQAFYDRPRIQVRLYRMQ